MNFTNISKILAYYKGLVDQFVAVLVVIDKLVVSLTVNKSVFELTFKRDLQSLGPVHNLYTHLST